MKPSEFQDNPTHLTFLGWKRKANEDRKDAQGNITKSWKDCLDYVLKYSYPEYAKDKAGEQLLDKKGAPLRNRNWLPEYPHGYSIVYSFEEGTLESGSYPLFLAFCRTQPKPNERLILKRTGEKTDTEWHLQRASAPVHQSEVPDLDVDEFGADTNTPF